MRKLLPCIFAVAVTFMLWSSLSLADEVLFEQEWNFYCLIGSACGDCKTRVDLKGHEWIAVTYEVFGDDDSEGSIYLDMKDTTEVLHRSVINLMLHPHRDFVEVRQSYGEGKWFFRKHNRIKIVGR